MKSFYKSLVSGKWELITNEDQLILPTLGKCRLVSDKTRSYVWIYEGELRMGGAKITDLIKNAAGDKYATIAEFIEATSDFFADAPALTGANLANNLTTEEPGKALDSTQGKVLNDRIDNIPNVVIAEQVISDAVTAKNNANTAASNANTTATNVAAAEAARVAAGSEVKTNKQNSLIPDGTGLKYPTVDAVNYGLMDYAKLLVGKNKFNKNDSGYQPGYAISSDGSIVVNASYNTTGYTPIIIGNTLTGNCLSGYNIRIINFYDANKVLLTTVQSVANVIVPANAYYCRVAFSSSRLASAYQLEYGNAPTAYAAYIENVLESVIPTTIPRKSEVALLGTTPVMTVGKNLYNPADCVFGDAWGSPNANYNTTGYIDIHGNEGSPLWTSNNGVSAVIRQCKFYNSSKVIIGGTVDYPISGYIIPVGAYYVKYSFEVVFLKLQVELGAGVTSYQAFGYFVPEVNIPSTIQRVVSAIDEMPLAPKLYLTNQTTDLFFDPMVKNLSLRSERFVRLSITNASIVRQFRKLVTIAPTSNGVATFKLYDSNFDVIVSKNISTVVTPLSKTGNLKTIFIGSSITFGAEYIEYIKTKCGTGISFLGMRHTNAGGVYHEGRGGWGLTTFASPSINTWAYNPFWQPATGRFWGAIEYWNGVMNHAEFGSGQPYSYDQDGFKTSATNAGFLSTGYISGANLQVDDLMYSITNSTYTKWDGSTWVNVATPATWGFDLIKYGAMWNISAPDVIVLAELSTNDFRGAASTPNFTNWNNLVNLFLTALKLWNANAKLLLSIPISTFGEQVSSTEFMQSANYRMWQSRQSIVNTFSNRESDGLIIIDDAIYFDQDYGFSLATDSDRIKPNQEYTGTETMRVGIDTPHPSSDGRKLLGKGFLGIIQYLRS